MRSQIRSETYSTSKQGIFSSGKTALLGNIAIGSTAQIVEGREGQIGERMIDCGRGILPFANMLFADRCACCRTIFGLLA